jgi:hypothetical protein
MVDCGWWMWALHPTSAISHPTFPLFVLLLQPESIYIAIAIHKE